MTEGSVLVVDDEPNIALSLEYLMREQGFEVRVVNDGDAAIAAMRSAVPDVVLLDVMMPGKDGYEICQLIRATPEWSQVRVIMLTAKGRSIEQEKGLALGADDYVTKPFSTRAVVERVQHYMNDRAG